MEITEDKISELEGRLIEFAHSEQQRENRLGKKSRNKLTFITSELEKERRRREKVRQKNIVEEIILENSPNLAKDISLG